MKNKELHRSNGAVFRLDYHLILCVKYRRKAFDNENIIEAFKKMSKEIAEKCGVNVLSQECGQDHAHLLISTKPTTNLTRYVNILKGHTARFLRKQYSEDLKDKLWGDSFWSDSYYIASVGNTSIKTLYKYIEKQKK